VSREREVAKTNSPQITDRIFRVEEEKKEKKGTLQFFRLCEPFRGKKNHFGKKIISMVVSKCWSVAEG